MVSPYVDELQGTLSGIGVPALIRLLSGVGKTGCLRLGGGVGEAGGAQLFLEQGELTAAFWGEETGLEALDAVLILRPGAHFTFLSGQRPPRRNVSLGGAPLRYHIDHTAVRAVELRAAVPSILATPKIEVQGAESGAGVAPSARHTLTLIDGHRTVQEIAVGRGIARTIEDVSLLAGMGLVSLGGPAPRVRQPAVSQSVGGAPASSAEPAPDRAPDPVPLVATSTGRSRKRVGALVGGLAAATIAVPIAAWALAGGRVGPAVEEAVLLPPPVATQPAVATATPDAAVAGSRLTPAGPATPAPTAAPAPPASPTAVASAVVTRPEPIGARAAVAVSELRTGEIESSLSLDGADQSAARLIFDLGDDKRPPRMRMSSTFTGPAGSRTVERIVVGEQIWERQGGGAWRAIEAHGSVFHQVQALLPRPERVPTAEIVPAPDGAALRWQEPGYGADVTLHVDASTAQPRVMERATRATGGLLRVTYSAWNTPVEIAPPAGA